MLLVIMGVCGSGKTSVGENLAKKLEWLFADADDYHPKSNRVKMANKTPLTDQDRLPWLIALHQLMKKWKELNANGIVTCSALKKSYRYILDYGQPLNAAFDECSKMSTDNMDRYHETKKDPEADVKLGIMFVHLQGTYNLIMTRMESRKDHFMPPALLESQLQTLELPDTNETHFTVNIDKSVDEIVTEIIENLHKREIKI